MWLWHLYEADVFAKYDTEEILRRIERAQLIHPRKRSRPSVVLTLKGLLSRLTWSQADQAQQRAAVAAGSVTGCPQFQECC